MASAEAEKRKAYLLGLLSEEEATRLEEAYFAEESGEEMVLAEDDLIDEYIDGGLSEAERRAFEARRQERPELDSRVESRRRLTRALRRRGKGESADASLWNRRRRILAVAAAAAAVFVTVRYVQEKPATHWTSAAVPLPRARVEVAREAVIRPPSVPVVLLLGAGGVREASAVPTTTLAPEIPALRLRLPGTAAGPLRAVVENVDGGVAWRGAARAVDEGRVPHVEAEVPASALPAGDYIVRYHGLRGGDEEAFFRVKR